MSLRLSSVVLLTAASIGLQAQEWTRFRGPNGSGIGKTTGLPSEFTSADHEWQIELPGVGHSSPVLWGDLLFLTVADGAERKVLAIDPTSGAQVWEYIEAITEYPAHRFNNFASSTPTCDANGVYLVWATGTQTVALALNHKGEKLWHREWPGFTSDHGQGASPVLIQGKLIFHTDAKDDYKSQIYALDPKTGETAWELERISPASDEKHLTSYSTPTEVMAGTRPTIAVVQTNDGWKGIDPLDGSVAWAYDGNYTQRSVGSIVENNGVVFATFGSGGDGKESSALKPNATGKPDVVYSLGKGNGLSYVPTPLVYEGLLYLWNDSGILTCCDAATGEKIYGGTETRMMGNFFSSPIGTDGKIYCGSKDGDFLCVATGRDFKILGRSKLSSGVNATPAVANGRLFVRTDTHLFSLKGK